MRHDARRIVALLPMKAHSERVTGKNFREFNGKPLFRWMLDTLLSLDRVAEIVINTDARETLAAHGVAALPRVTLRERKPELRGDAVSMNLVIADDLENVPADVYLMTHTTNPLLGARTVEAALDAFLDARERSAADSLFTVNRFQSRFYRADGGALNHDPANLVRTQDLEPWFEENSNLYIFTRESFARTNARIGEKPMMFEVPRSEAFDIDDQAGWDLAELVCRGTRGAQ